MSFDSALLYSFLLVFVRCSAMLLVSPMFGAQNSPMLAWWTVRSTDGTHGMIITFARSYETMPPLGYVSIPGIRTGIISLIGGLSLLALQIAAPVMAVSMIVDAGLGIVNKAVPQMQA